MKTLKQIREAKSGGKEAYQKFFNSLLKKFGVSSPSELEGDQKKKFYDELDAGWESDDPNDKNERYEDPEGLDPETTHDSDEDMADKAASQVNASYGKMNAGYIKSAYHKEDVNHPKPLSIIRSNKLSGDALEEAYDMNEKMVMCEQCGKMHEEGACGEMKENKMLGNMDTALASLSKKPEYKKISKNLMSLSKRAAERDKGAPKQLKTQLASLASKVDKKAGAALMKMSKLAGTYESVEIDEMKMDDPKLNKIFDKLKKGQTIKLKTSSTISKGKDFVDYIVKSKNTVNKGRVEKVTLVTKGNEKAVKKFLYKRDGKVTFAIGDMGASIDDIKEELDEGRMKELHGYIEKGMSAQDIAKKMKLDVKTIKSLMDETDLEEAKSSTGYELYHKDFSSAMQHAYAFAKKKFGIEVDPKEIDDKVATGPKKPSNGKTNSYSLKSKDGKKGIQVQVYNTGKNYELNMYKEEVVSEEEEPQKPDSAKEVEQVRDDKKKTRIAQLQLQIAKATETINKLNAQEK